MSDSQAQMEVTVTVGRIRQSRPSSKGGGHWTVFEATVLSGEARAPVRRGQRLNCVGVLPQAPQQGDQLRLALNETTHEKWGKQYEIVACHAHDDSSRPATLTFHFQVSTIRQQRGEAWVVAEGLPLDTVAGGPMAHFPATIVGEVPNCHEGQFLRVTVTRKESAFGVEWSIQSALPALPQSGDALRVWLERNCQGIGPARARTIVETWGETTGAVLGSDVAVDRLVSEARVPQSVAEDLVSIWRARQQEREMLTTLIDGGLTYALAARVFGRFTTRLAPLLQNNPYRVMDVEGVSFAMADRLAKHLGVDHYALVRLWAGLVETLGQQVRAGHCWLERESLLTETTRLIQVPRSDLGNLLATAPDSAPVHVDGQGRTWLRAIEQAEQQVATTLNDLMRPPRAAARATLAAGQAALATLNWEAVWTASSVPLAPTQQEAVRTLLQHPVALLTGGPGTGKTTVLRTVLAAARQASLSVSLCAPTGKAARRMSEATGWDAHTIHRLFHINLGSDEGNGDPVSADLVVVDEASMVDVLLLRQMVTALQPGQRLLLVGDTNQLPSVGPGQVLEDLTQAGVPRVHLTEVFRQAAQSRIVANAHAIMDGDPLVWEGDARLMEDATEHIATRVAQLARQWFPQHGVASEDVRVLAPMRRGEAGVEMLNRVLQEALNPPSGEKQSCPWRGGTLREGDLLLWTRNVEELGLVNGQEVRVRRIQRGEGGAYAVTFLADGADSEQQVLLSFLEATHGWAMTVHKSQGSEYGGVIVIADEEHGHMLDRRLFYTAITRARQQLVVLGQKDAVSRAIASQRSAQRRTALRERLEYALAQPVVEAASAQGTVRYTPTPTPTPTGMPAQAAQVLAALATPAPAMAEAANTPVGPPPPPSVRPRGRYITR